MAQRLTLMALIAWSSVAFGQDVPDLTGRWAYTVNGLAVHERCGQEHQAGEMVIDKKITARAYRGKVRVERSMEQCPGSYAFESGATIRVKEGNLVTIDFDEDNWGFIRARYVDDTLNGEVDNQISVSIERMAEDGATEGLTDEQLVDLDEFLGEVGPELSALLKEEFYEKYRKYLYKSGLGEDDAKQVADLTIDRMTNCTLEMMRDSVMVQAVPIERLLAQGGAAIMFDPDNMDPRTEECIKDAERNAGIRIY